MQVETVCMIRQIQSITVVLGNKERIKEQNRSFGFIKTLHTTVVCSAT